MQLGARSRGRERQRRLGQDQAAHVHCRQGSNERQDVRQKMLDDDQEVLGSIVTAPGRSKTRERYRCFGAAAFSVPATRIAPAAAGTW
jgi:hypothetical protein